MAITGRGKDELIGFGFKNLQRGKSIVNLLSAKGNYADTDTAEKTIWRDWFFTAASGASYTITAAVGTFTLTGNAANLKADRKITAAVGTYTLTGNAANLKADRKIVVGLGTYTLTGNTANMVAVSYTHLRAHETELHLVCRLLLEKTKQVLCWLYRS